MARPGVSYKEIADAAMQLFGEGRNPTVEQVRLILGKGSSTTIANHLRQWKANQESDQQLSMKENIPNELVSVMKGLWERVINHSEEEVDDIKKGFEESIIALQQELNKYKSNNKRWQKLYEKWNQEKAQLTNEKLTLEQALDFAYKENTSLHAKEDGYRQQLQDKQERIEELNQLHVQTQANLEQLYKAVQDQRLREEKHEKERQQFTIEIKQLTDQISSYREKTVELQQQLKALEQSNSTLEKTTMSIQSKLDKTNDQLRLAELAKTEYQQKTKHWESQYQELQQSHKEQTRDLIDKQAENKQLMLRLSDLDQSLSDMKEQIRLLNHEKWILSQEKIT